jgi:hypothetical protein
MSIGSAIVPCALRHSVSELKFYRPATLDLTRISFPFPDCSTVCLLEGRDFIEKHQLVYRRKDGCFFTSEHQVNTVTGSD